MTSDEEFASVLGFIFGLIVGGVLMTCIITAKKDMGHFQLGTASHTCFANRTCRQSLQCHVTQSMPDGICLEK